MKTIIFSFFLLLTQPAFAVLAPLNQSIAELQDIMAGKALSEQLPASQAINSIDSVAHGYVIRTQDYQMFVEVKFLPQTKPGPAQFELIFHEPTKIQQ